MRSTRTPGMKLSATRPAASAACEATPSSGVGGIAPPRRQRDVSAMASAASATPATTGSAVASASVTPRSAACAVASPK